VETAIAPDEIPVEVRIAGAAARAASAYASLEQRASGYAIVGAAAIVGDGPTRVGVTGAGPAAYRARAVEEALAGGASIADAAAHATDGVDVATDIHADREYRTAMAAVYVRRALEAATARAG